MHNPDAILPRGTSAAREARQLRQGWFADITAGEKTCYDLIKAACAADGSGPALHKLKILRVLEAQPDCSAREARAILRKTVSLLDKRARSDLNEVTIGWLIDSRAGGRRIATYLDVTTSLQVPEGFPWSRVPDPVAGTFPAPTPLGYSSVPASSPTPVTPPTYDDPWADEE